MLKKYKERIDTKLEELISSNTSKLDEAMRYSVLNGGKRLRPTLTYLTGIALGSDIEQLDAAAMAVELSHCYSLVHDDLPAMDNDDLRRGKPTCHIQFDEATAILVGDALQTLAFEVLTKDDKLDAKVQINLVSTLAKAIGHEGMCLGQSLDMIYEKSNGIALGTLEDIHANKTGKLILACCQMGAIIAGHTNDNVYTGISEFARNLGLGFQIRDDVLDIEGNTDLLGKPQGSDTRNNKLTYLSHFSLEELKTLLEKIESSSLALLKTLPGQMHILEELASFMLRRNY